MQATGSIAANPGGGRSNVALGVAPRIVGLVALILLASGGLIAYLGVNNSRDALQEQILKDAQTQADLAAAMTQNYVNSARDPLIKLANGPAVQQLVRSGTQQRELQVTLAIVSASQPGFQNVSIYNSDGELVARAANTTPATNVALREWFFNTKASGKPYTGFALTSAASGRPVVPLTAPMFDESGQMFAMVVGTLSLDSVADTLDFADRGPASEVTLIDRRQAGVVLAQHDNTGLLEPNNASDQLRAVLLSGDRSAKAVKNQDGKDVLIAVTPTSDFPWAVIVQQSRSVAFAPVTALTRKSLLIAIPVILMGCVLSALLALQITRPLVQLRQAARSLGSGSGRKRLNFKQRNEIGDLGRVFDSMAQTIEDRTAEMENAVQSLIAEAAVRERAEADLRSAHEQLETRVRERTADLARANEELRRSNSELEQFAYVASHDLQEPLRMVGNYTQLLGRRYKGKLDEDADAFIGFAVEGAHRMQQLINDLLEFSRVGTKGKDLTPTDMEMASLRALANLQAAIEESGARIERYDLPTVMADETQIVQLLQNLVANAIKFHGTYAPVIEIGAEQRGEYTEIWVRDNGIGIEPQYFERIFVLFQRLHTRDDYAGTGIGLAVCKRIVERHGGRIWVDSTPGQGTTFYFTLKNAAVESSPRTDLVAGEAA